MVRFNPISVYEGQFFIKTLSGEDERRRAYRLRHDVFAERLRWVAVTPTGLEIDRYDQWATQVGLFSAVDRLLGLFRILPTIGPFMLEQEFRPVLGPDRALRRAPDTAEITRLALDPAIQDKGLSSQLMLVLFKGVYQWSLSNEIRFLYMVVEKRFLRVLRAIGFPCEALSPGAVLPPANALSVPAVLDWDVFREESTKKRPAFLAWMAAGQAVSAPVNGHATVGAGAGSPLAVSNAVASGDEQMRDHLVSA